MEGNEMSPGKSEDLSVIKHLSRGSLVDRTFDEIQEGIVNHRIKPGTKLRQIQLAQQLDVSPRTVREALNRLVITGLAIRDPYKGVRVADLSVEAMMEVFQLRGVLECWAMELAVETITDEEIVRMREILPKTVNLDSDAMIKVRDANYEFHMIPILSTGKEHLIRISEQLWNIMSTFVLREIVDSEDKRQKRAVIDLDFHKRILNSLEKRDKERARKAVQEHVEDTIQANLERLKKH